MSYSGCFATYCVFFDLLFVALATNNLCCVVYFLTLEQPIKTCSGKIPQILQESICTKVPFLAKCQAYNFIKQFEKFYNR